MSTPTVLVLPSSEPSSTPSPQLNLLPFHTPFSGPAPISTYFLPRSTPDSRESALPGSTLFLSAFRGRQLVGQKLEVPSGYEGVVLSVPEKKRAVKRDLKEEEEEEGGRRELVQRELVKDAGEGGRRVSPRKRKAVDKFGGASSSSISLKKSAGAKVTKKFRIDSDSEEEDHVEPQPQPQPQPSSTTSSTPLTSISTPLSPLPTLTETSISSSTITSPPPSPPLQLINDTLSRSPSPTPLSPTSQPVPQPEPHQQVEESHVDLENDNMLLPPPPPARELKIVSTFGNEGIVLWSADDPVDEGRDEYFRCLGKGGWMELAELLHQEEAEDGEEEE